MCGETRLKQIIHEVSAKTQTALGESLREIILYGSYARGDYDDESDIDIMVLADIGDSEERKLQKSLDKISGDVSLDNDITVSILLKDKRLFSSRVGVLPFYRNIAMEGVEVYGV